MSQTQDQDLYYDYDRDIAALNRTPPLVAIKPNFESRDSPGPLVALSHSSDSSDAEDTDGAPTTRKRRRRRKGRTNPSFADGVLIRSLDPNQPGLAAHVERNALESASQSEAEEGDDEAGNQADRQQISRANGGVESQPGYAAPKPKEIAKAALNVISLDRDREDDWPMIDVPAGKVEERLRRQPRSGLDDTRESKYKEPATASSSSKPGDPPKKRLNTLPPPLNQGLGLTTRPNQEDEGEEDSIIKSPTLGKFAIARHDAPPDSILPALQPKSPQRSSLATLPGLHTAIGNYKDPNFAMFATMSPIGRPSPGYLGPYASPASYSAMSPPPPPGPPYQYDWRTTRDSNISTSSNYTSSSATTSSNYTSSSTTTSSYTSTSPTTSSSYTSSSAITSPNYTSSSATTSTPASSAVVPSPAASHPTSMAPVAEEDDEETLAESSDESELSSPPESQPEVLPDDGRSTRIHGAYRCTHQGCSAAPFQTQYLLNSHMNVHSNTRTHFCPVKGCPRGPGGQGFKRKNEMIRHGLVHTSPGYICPFCPDQQHKYPRPDNLQRHVRQHHVDRDRDDPVLRDVLNQRMEGGSRGGRRRMRL